MKSKKTIIAFIPAFVCLGLAGCNTGEAKLAEPAVTSEVAAMPVEVVFPGRADIFATYHTTGALESDDEARVVPKVSGEIVEILVEEGDAVSQGQLLARLDGDRLRLQMLQAKATLEKTSRDYERNVRLQERGLVSAAVAEDLKYELVSQQAAFELAKLNYSYTNIRAPISGVVSARDIKLGQHIDVNTSAFSIVDNEQLIAYLKIPQNELGKFAVGHSVNVQFDAFADEVFPASIVRISPTVDTANGTFRATAYVDNDKGILAPGMFGRFDIAYEKHSAALTIPSSALVREDKLAAVYVVKDGAAVRKPVVTGIESNGLVEIVSGLEEGEQIIVSGQSSLRDGSKVLASVEAPVRVAG